MLKMSVEKIPFYTHHKQKVSVLPGHTDAQANQLLDGRSSGTVYIERIDPVSLRTDAREDWRDERCHGHKHHTCSLLPPVERSAEPGQDVASAAAAVAAAHVFVRAAVPR